MRNKLIDIMMHTKITPQEEKLQTEWYAEAFADELIAKGVIVPSFIVGDTVWVYDEFMWGLIPCTIDKPYHCVCGEDGGCTFEMHFDDDDIGKIVFGTKEEAECVLQYKKEEEFKRFLELPEDKRFEYLTGTKLNWLQRIHIKFLNNWWTSMRNANPHLQAFDLWESMYKNRF